MLISIARWAIHQRTDNITEMELPCKEASSFSFLTFGDGRLALFAETMVV